MGIIREPKGIDFVIQSPPPTDEELKEISEFIEMRKRQKQTLRKDDDKINQQKVIVKA